MEAVKNLIWGDQSQTNTSTPTNDATTPDPTSTNNTGIAETEKKMADLDIKGGAGKENAATGVEPVSGEMGDVERGEPYDKGNLDSTNAELTSRPTEPTPSTESAGIAESNPTEPTPKIESTGVADSKLTSTSTTTNPVNPTPPTIDPTSTTAQHTRDAASSAKPTSATPATSAPETSEETQGIPGTKNQGADAPEHAPEGSHRDAIKETKEDAEAAQAVDISGPGPKPLAEKAKESGGVAGSTEGQGEGGEDDGPQKESKGEGTGEKYVKSSGVNADGGDFDAANPGAGKEADSLLEEKGVKREVPGAKGSDESVKSESQGEEAGNGGGKEKKSIKEKIKEKLHIHKEKD